MFVFGFLSFFVLFCFVLFLLLFMATWNMEVLGLGVKLELQLRHKPQPQQHWIQAVSVTDAAPCSSAGSLTHLAKLGMESHPHRDYVQPQWELSRVIFVTDFQAKITLPLQEVTKPAKNRDYLKYTRNVKMRRY